MYVSAVSKCMAVKDSTTNQPRLITLARFPGTDIHAGQHSSHQSSSSMTLISESFLPSFIPCSFRFSTSSCCRFSDSIFSFSLMSAVSMLVFTSGRLGKCSLRSLASSSGSLSPSSLFFLKVAKSLRNCRQVALSAAFDLAHI